MDLTSVLLRVAARRPHVLTVPAVGGTAARLAVEAATARRGWPSAAGPADAELVVVAGSPGPELETVVERVWQQVPKPRARVVVTNPADVDRQLDAAAVSLADRDHQRTGQQDHAGHGGHQEDGGHHEDGGGHQEDDEEHGHDDAQDGDRGDRSGSEDHGGQHDHHGHGGGMEMPGGLPMADLGEDRDGLALDRLHVPLGPVLPDWPAGLVVRVTLQGDVVQEAATEVLDGTAGSPFWQRADNVAARELDALARLLGVAGWSDVSEQARRLRDDLLAHGPTEQVCGAVAALARRVRRSRAMRWMLRRIPAGANDVAGVVEQRLAAIEAALMSGGSPPVPRPAPDDVAGLLVGAEFAAARLIVAALDPDTEQVAAQDGTRHG